MQEVHQRRYKFHCVYSRQELAGAVSVLGVAPGELQHQGDSMNAPNLRLVVDNNVSLDRGLTVAKIREMPEETLIRILMDGDRRMNDRVKAQFELSRRGIDLFGDEPVYRNRRRVPERQEGVLLPFFRFLRSLFHGN